MCHHLLKLFALLHRIFRDVNGVLVERSPKRVRHFRDDARSGLKVRGGSAKTGGAIGQIGIEVHLQIKLLSELEVRRADVAAHVKRVRPGLRVNCDGSGEMGLMRLIARGIERLDLAEALARNVVTGIDCHRFLRFFARAIEIAGERFSLRVVQVLLSEMVAREFEQKLSGGIFRRV